MAILEITPDLSRSITADRILQLLQDCPEGLTLKELSDALNRPISMLQICLKNSIVSHKIAIERRARDRGWVKVYILKPAKNRLQISSLPVDPHHSGVTPTSLREIAGLTKLQLADALGLNVRTINDWEQKRSQPRLMPSQIKQMMCVYQCTLDELIVAFE